MADLDSARKELGALAVIANSEQRMKAIYDKATVISELTGAQVSMVVEGMVKKVEAIIASQSQLPSDYVSNFMPDNGQAILSADLNQEGIIGSNITLQTPNLETKVGNIAGFVTSGIDAEAKVTAVAAGAKYVTPAFQSGEFKAVGIGVVSASMPANNAEMDASNISVTAGAAVWHKSGISSITTLSTDAKLGNLIIGQDFSKNLAQWENDTRLAAHVGGTYDVCNASTNITAGVMAQTRLTNEFTGWASADITLQDVGGKGEPVGMLKIGVNGTPASKHESSVEEDFNLRPVTHNRYAESEVLLSSTDKNHFEKAQSNQNNFAESVGVGSRQTKGEEDTLASMSREYYALEGHKRQQQAYLNNTAKNFSEMSGLDIRTSRQFVLNLFEYEHEQQMNHDLELT